jgi:FKBP-type peptidyl-prolyl cis-trans isomerase
MLRKLICLVALAASLSVCFAQEAPSDEDISRALGVVLGLQLKDIKMQFDYDIFAASLKATFENKDGADEAAAIATLQAAFKIKSEADAKENLTKGNAFLAENAKKKSVKTTTSGLQYEILDQGAGAKPDGDSLVNVYYKGTLIDGTVFDANTRENEGEPIEIPLYGVIPGWSEGVQLIGIGGRIKLFIPPDLGYGSEDAGDTIPANSVLIFEVELVSIIGSD